MPVDFIDLAQERIRRRPNPIPSLQSTTRASLPALCDPKIVAELFRYMEAQMDKAGAGDGRARITRSAIGQSPTEETSDRWDD